MKFFIDTANLDQIREANELGVLDGVTTNPSLMAKEGIKGVENQRRHYIKICEMVNGDVSAEVIATDYEGMIKEGEELAGLNPHIVVKVPCIEAGADVATCPLSAIKGLLKHPLTDSGLATFLADYKKVNG